MKSVIKLALWLATAAIMSVVPLASAAAETAPFTPQQGAVFSDPAGTSDQQQALITDVNNTINATPAGATISVATYGLNIQSTTDDLLAAQARGVNVRLVLDSGNATLAQEAELIQKLGNNTSSSSFTAVCKGSCLTHVAGTLMHAKIYLFSAAGSATDVAMTGSDNLTTSIATTSWNNMYTTVGNPVIYNSFLQYFTAMAKQVNQPNYYQTATSGNYKDYLYPRSGTNATDDTMLNVLKNVKCSDVASGYGVDGHTLIHVDMYYWSASRSDIAHELWDLDNAGCQVDVTYSGVDVDPSITAILLKPDAHSGIPVFDTDITAPNGHAIHTHDKFISISGNYYGNTASHLIFTGSANLTDGAEFQNCEDILRISDTTDYNAYMTHYHLLRDNYSVPVTKVPTAPQTATIEANLNNPLLDD